jgi:hypothetical protein
MWLGGARARRSRQLAFAFFVFVGNYAAATTETPLVKDLGAANGWREYHIAVDAWSYSWCGVGRLIATTRQGEVLLLDVGTGKWLRWKGGNATCSADGRFMFLNLWQANGSFQFAKVDAHTGQTIRQFAVAIHGRTKILPNLPYVFFDSSGTGAGVRRDGLYCLDTESGRTFTLYRQEGVGFKSADWVSPDGKYVVAPADFPEKIITLSRGETMTVVPLPAPRADATDSSGVDDWVWLPEERRFATLNWHTLRGFHVGVYDLPTLRRDNFIVNVAGIDYLGAELVRGMGGKAFINANNSDGLGGTLLQLNFAERSAAPMPDLQNVSRVSFSESSVLAFVRHFGVRFFQDQVVLSPKSSERQIAIYVADAQGAVNRIRNYPFGSNPTLGPFIISHDGRAIVFGRTAAEHGGEGIVTLLVQQ